MINRYRAKHRMSGSSTPVATANRKKKSRKILDFVPARRLCNRSKDQRSALTLKEEQR